MNENQIPNADELSMGETFSSSSNMEFDREIIKFESTLTSMSCIEDNSYTKSTLSMSHSSITVPGRQVSRISSRETLQEGGNEDLLGYPNHHMKRSSKRTGLSSSTNVQRHIYLFAFIILTHLAVKVATCRWIFQ